MLSAIRHLAKPTDLIAGHILRVSLLTNIVFLRYCFSSTEDNLNLSFSLSGGEGTDDEEVAFDEPPLDDDDDEPLTKPSSTLSPTPRPLTSSQQPHVQKQANKPGDKRESRKNKAPCISLRSSIIIIIMIIYLFISCFRFSRNIIERLKL